MIPTDLKPGALVRCVSPTVCPTGRLVQGQIYTVIGYNRNCGYTGESASVLLKGVRTHHTQGDQGWMRRRFELIRDGDGADYQAADDVDLVAEPTRREYLSVDFGSPNSIPAVDSPHYPRHDLTATEQRRQEQEAERLYASMTVRIERT
jgi:hypothetical protein